MSDAPQTTLQSADLIEKCKKLLGEHTEQHSELILGMLLHSLSGKEIDEGISMMAMILAQFCLATEETFQTDPRAVLLALTGEAANEITTNEALALGQEVEDCEDALEEFFDEEQFDKINAKAPHTQWKQ